MERTEIQTTDIVLYNHSINVIYGVASIGQQQLTVSVYVMVTCIHNGVALQSWRI